MFYLTHPNLLPYTLSLVHRGKNNRYTGGGYCACSDEREEMTLLLEVEGWCADFFFTDWLTKEKGI